MAESEETVWDDLSGIPADPPEMRNKCTRCRRPITVCWCPFLPSKYVETRCKVVILQHPAEEKRCLRTVPMLEHSLAPGMCNVYRSKRFPTAKQTGLLEILESPNTLVLYPSKKAVDIEEIPVVQDNMEPYNLVVIDGTWAQAKSIFHNTTPLHSLRQVKLQMRGSSEYVIRTQPNEGCLSTLEAVAESLGILEGQPLLKTQLLGPLHALCSFQLNHGAVPHQSKSTLVDSGGYNKPVGRRTRKKLFSHALTSVPSDS